MEREPEVIFIDDDKDLAQSYATLIKTKTSIECLAFTDCEVKEVEVAIDTYPIKVVVIDQKMPKIKGTELLPILRKHNSMIQFLMLTGEASGPDDLKDVLQAQGFAEKMHKSYVTSGLSNKIYQLIARYDEKIGENKIMTLKKPKRLRYTWKYSVYLMRYEILDDCYVDEKGWQCIESVNKGETKEKEQSVELSTTTEVKTESNEIDNYSLKVLSSYLLKVEGAWSKSKTKVSFKSSQNSLKRTEKTKMVLTLEDNERYDGKMVMAKLYEEKQAYKKLLVHVMYRCHLCRKEETKPIHMLLPLNKKKCRQHIITEGNHDYYLETGEKIIQGAS